MARGLAAIEPRQQEGKNRHRTVFSLRSPSNVPWWRGTVCSEGMQGSGTSSRTRSGGWRDAQAAAEARQAAVRRRGGRMNGGDVRKPRVAAHAICLQRGARARPHAATQRRLALYCGSGRQESLRYDPKQSKTKANQSKQNQGQSQMPRGEPNLRSCQNRNDSTPAGIQNPAPLLTWLRESVILHISYFILRGIRSQNVRVFPTCTHCVGRAHYG